MLLSCISPFVSGSLQVKMPPLCDILKVRFELIGTWTRSVENGNLSTVMFPLNDVPFHSMLPSGRTTSPTPDNVEFEKQKKSTTQPEHEAG